MREQNERTFLPFIVTQKWENLLFLHWPVPPEYLSEQIPSQLELDLYGGRAWLGFVFFQVKGMRPRFLLPLPYLSSFLQLNIRTYVTYQGLSGVYFFHLDVNKLPTCLLGKTVYSLPFRKAEMAMEKKGSEVHIFSSWQKGTSIEELSCSYTLVSSPFYPKTDTIDYWLLERYHLWNINAGKVFRTNIAHPQWMVQKAKVKIQSCSMVRFLPAAIFQQKPLIHYASFKQAFFSLPVQQS